MDNPITEEKAETPQASPAEEKTPEVTESENVVASNPPQETQTTEEEAAWNSLKGSTQERIKQILHERDDAREKVAQPTQNQVTQPTYPAQASDDEVIQAANILKTKGNLVSRDELDALVWTLDKEKKHERLADKYSGSDGISPKYDRSEVEDYMNRKKIWDPEVAFRDMYFDEFTDQKKTQKKQVYTEKPTATAGRDEPLTLESFRSKLKNDPAYYDKLVKNRDQFDKIIEQLTQE